MKKSIGVAIFSDSKLVKDGYFTSDDSNGASNGVNELSTDKVWVTNIRPYDFSTKGYLQVSHCRSGRFFRSEVEYLGRELGLVNDNVELSEVLQAMFTRSGNYIERNFGFDPTESAVTISKDLAGLFVPSKIFNPVPGIDGLDEAIIQSCQYNQGMVGRASAGSKLTSFVFPRTEYAAWLLDRDLPSNGSWKHIAPKESGSQPLIGRSNGRDGLDAEEVLAPLIKLAEDGCVVMLRISVMEVDSGFAAHSTFGVGDRGPQRGWALLEEVLQMSEYSLVKVGEGFIGGKEKCNLPFFNSSEFSLSRSVANENLWISCRLNPSSTAKHIWTAYLSMLDRWVLNRAARHFHRQGFAVGSYGTGRLSIFVRKTELHRACKVAMQCGLLPPMNLVEEIQIDHINDVAFNSKLYYCDNKLDTLCKSVEFTNRLSGSWIRKIVLGALVRKESPLPYLLKVDELLDVNEEEERASRFKAIVGPLFDELESVLAKSEKTKDSPASEDSTIYY